MKFSNQGRVIAVLLIAFAVIVNSLSAQTEEDSSAEALRSTEVQSNNSEPELKQPIVASNDDTTLADVEIDRRFNELRRELLDDRAKTIDWWLAIIAIFLTFLAIIIPIAAVIGGLFGFKKFKEIKEEAQHHLEDIRKSRTKAVSLLKEINAEDAGANPDKASEVVENVQRNPEASLIERAVVTALLLQQQNRIEEAIEKWHAVAFIAEESDKDLAARAWFSVGYLLGRKNEPNFNAVISAYGKALRLKPDFADAYINRGNALSQLGQHEAALTDYDKALRLNPDLAEAYLNRGVAQADLGQYEKALADYNEALRLKPNLAEAYLNRGEVYTKLDQYEKALADYNEALRLKPNYAEAYYNRGTRRNRLGQHEAAIADFDEAIRLKPDYALAYDNRGTAKAKLGQYEAAIADFDKAIRLKPDFDGAY